MIRWGIIGAGRVANHMATAINASQTLVGVVGRNIERAQSFADQHSTVVFDSVDALASEVDALYIASPNAFHLEHVTIAAQHEAHVLCEKPLANSVEEAIRIHAICNEHDVRLGMAVQYRQHLAHREIRSRIAQGEIGSPVFADASVHLPPMDIPEWYRDQSVAAGGIIPMSGVHRLDLLRYVLDDEVIAVLAVERSRLESSAYEDTVACILEFAGGTIATVRFAMNAASDGEGISINGDHGWMRAEHTTSSWWSTHPAALHGHVTSGVVNRTFPQRDLYADQVVEFSEAVRGGSQFCSTGLDGIRAAEITAAIHQSATDGSRVLIGAAQ